MGSVNTRLDITIREMDVLRILWQADEPLIASEILKRGDGLNINTIQAVLRSLMKKEYIEVGDIVFSGKVLSRSYRATKLSYQQMLKNFAEQAREVQQYLSMPEIMTAFFGSTDEDEAIKNLEAYIKAYKKNQKKG